MELLLVLLGFLGLAAAGGVALVYLWTAPSAPAAAPPTPAKRAPTPPTTPRPVPQDDVDDVTIITFQPMVLQEAAPAPKPKRSSGPVDMVHTIVADAGASDDEPSAAHALILLSAVAQSHRGRRRKNNEDSFLVSERHHLFIVADGMGGYAGGEIASALATETILATYDEDAFGEPEGELPQAASNLVSSIRKANLAIYERALAEPELMGMGTTLVSIRFSPRKERMYIGHVGDSRVYRYRKGLLEQLTTDHTLAAMGVEGPQAHSLTRAVGVGPTLEVDLLLAEPEAGDSYLLCSDGLTKMCPHETIQAVLAASEDAQVAVQALIDNANARGGKDNVTVIVVQVRDVNAMPVVEDPEVPAEVS